MIKSLQKNLLSYSCATGFALVGIMFLFQPSAYAVNSVKVTTCSKAHLAFKKCKGDCDKKAKTTLDTGYETTQQSLNTTTKIRGGDERGGTVKSLAGQEKTRIDAAKNDNYTNCLKSCIQPSATACPDEVTAAAAETNAKE